MTNSGHIETDIINRYATGFPWGIYIFDTKTSQLQRYGFEIENDKYMETEKYLDATIKDVCTIAFETQKIYTETSPSGITYIALPLEINNRIWAVMATYLAIGKEGSWSRTLFRGCSVAEALDQMQELGSVLCAYRHMHQWDDNSDRDNSHEESVEKDIESGKYEPYAYYESY